MGGNSETGAGVADCSIGSIVWVRRRNGSWWPGKILGPDELSASHVMSPRSGTPVKLLGREDASVDWYNLEKSKRVKAFRCGEFDDCIEKAEASQGMPPKKREKYARREDAILHALELERQMLEKKCEKVGHSSKGESTVSPYGVKKASLMSSQNLETGNGKHLQPETHQACESLCLPFKAKGEDQDMRAERVKEENQLSVDEDNSGVPPRTRGLQDFGLRTVPLKFKASPVASPNGSHKPSFDSSVQSHSNDGLATEDMVDATSENSTDKRKRSHNSGEDSLAKRRERRRPLLQVLENSSKVLVPHSQADDDNANYTPMSDDEQPGIAFPVKRSRYTCLQPVDLDEENNTGSTEDTETDSSETDSLDSDTDELASLSEGAASIELQPKYPRRCEAWAEDKSLGSEELDDLALSDEISKPCYYGPASASMGVSRWQLKGKRNNRSLLKRPVDGSDRNFSWGSIDEPMSLEMGANGQDETYSVGKNFMPQMAGHVSRGSDGIGRRTVQWQHWDWNDHRAIKGYWEDAGKYFDPVYVGRHHIGGRSILVDVDLKVQSSYQREHVPMISLMSKINGQAIVGHPIPIEVLENGSSESLLAETDEWSPEIVENETALPPMWRTARRTSNFRVPRPDLSSTCDESAKNLQFVDSRRGHPENSDAGAIGHTGGIMEKHATHVPVDRKFSRKPLKKISLSSNQKIRTLSSIASQQKPSTDSRQSGNNFRVDGLKPESVSTAVACIPVKLVFSRLQEELVGRHS